VNRKQFRHRFFVLAAALLAVTNRCLGEPQFTVPNGFMIEKVATNSDLKFPMFACFDQIGNLYVAQSSGGDLYDELQKQSRGCRISLLTAQDDSGAFDRGKVFAEHLVFPMGLAWRDGKLYVADPPDLITLEDTDGDGRADKRTVILSGFGHRDNGSLHGLTFGPDGWLYMTMGSPDGYRFQRADGSILSGTTGALLRCRPDGSDIEVISRGFENLVEVAFMPGGEIVGTDNWFLMPTAGVRDGLVHLLEGGAYPLGTDQGSAKLTTGELLPAIAMYPAVALSGLARFRGDGFGPDSKDALFSAQHNTRKIVKHRLEPLGATFRSVDQDFVTTDDPDFHPSDVLQDADGSLLIIDTGSWYIHHCPTGRIRKTTAKGGIYRVRKNARPRPQDPWGRKLNWASLSTRQLIEQLADQRIAVRDQSVQMLIAKGEMAVDPLTQLLRTARSEDVKEEIGWTLARIGTTSSLLVLRDELKRARPISISRGARALARTGDKGAKSALEDLLQHEDLHVRLAAAEALAHCGDQSSVPALAQALTSQLDKFLEHALIHALYRLAAQDQLAALLQQKAPRVQKAAMILLDQEPHNKLAAEAAVARLFDREEILRSTARFILQRHPESVSQIVPTLRRIFTNHSTAELGSLREALLAFHSHPEISHLIAEAVSSQATDTSEALRIFLIGLMRQTTTEVPPEWVKALRAAFESGSTTIRAEVIQTTRSLRLRGLDDLLSALARESAKPVRV